MIIGIDLGTTNSCMATIKEGRPYVIKDIEGNSIIPSAIYVDDNGEIVVGNIAKAHKTKHLENTLLSVKRHMGSDEKLIIGNKEMTPVEVSTEILKYLKKVAEEEEGEEVTGAVITVPAYFNNLQRQATKQAGIEAGLDVLRIINEPTSATLAYGKEFEKPILVYDLGGGTFDTSLVVVNDGVYDVVATCGNTKLGGDDFDYALVDYIVNALLDGKEQYKNKSVKEVIGINAYEQLKEIAEKVKIKVSEEGRAVFKLPENIVDDNLPMSIPISRLELNEIYEPIISKTFSIIDRVLDDSNYKVEDIDRIILVGGSTKYPLISEKLEERYKLPVYKDINPDECVAVGASIQAGIIEGIVDDILLLDVTPLSLGIETVGNRMTVMLPRNSKIPTEFTKTFTTTYDYQEEIKVNIYQGERIYVKNNILLGTVSVPLKKKQLKGVPQVDITFSIDTNGILKVTANNEGETVTLDIERQEVSYEEVNERVKSAKEHNKADLEDFERNMKKYVEYSSIKDVIRMIYELDIPTMKSQIDEFVRVYNGKLSECKTEEDYISLKEEVNEASKDLLLEAQAHRN